MAEAAKKARRERIEAEAQRTAERRPSGYAVEDRHAQPSHARRHEARHERHRERDERRAAERDERNARKAARREERRARRYDNGSWRRPRRPVPPGIFLGIFILIALQVASIATFALFQVLLPTLFTFLASPMRRQRMLEIGQAGQRGLRTAREHIRYQFLGGPTPAGFDGRVDEPVAQADDPAPHAASTPERPRQRISIDAVTDEIEAEAEAFEAKLEERLRDHR
jgi:hypothetical protein